MVLRKLVGLFACTLILGAASFALAGVPDLEESTAAPAFTTGDIVLYSLPNGAGNAFTQCRYWDGVTPGANSVVVDGTVTLTLRDASMAPISDFPFEDLWLEARDGGLFICAGGSTADANTDALGQTTWVNPLRCGGWSTDLAQVMVNGDALTSDPGMALHFNSADINGSGQVELSDVTAFSGDFFGAYAFRSDFTYDGALDLLDVTKLSAGFGAQCQ
jgi:hypothetical protein